MTDQSKQKIVDVSDEELIRLRDALLTKYGSYLKPGESLSIDAERTVEHSWASIVLERGQDLRVELEAAALPADTDRVWDANSELENVLDFLDVNLEEFFEEDRHARWHDDWRQYDYHDSVLRFRGSIVKPGLEALADEWLAGAEDSNRKDFD